MKNLIIAMVLALPLYGCVSVMGRADGMTWGHPYAATRLAMSYASEDSSLLAEVPFDTVLDTVLLPFDLLIYPFVH